LITVRMVLAECGLADPAMLVPGSVQFLIEGMLEGEQGFIGAGEGFEYRR
jgi:hypothetical protein